MTAELGKVGLSADQIRLRAYEFYEARCWDGGSGDALADWIAAERELKARESGNHQTAPAGNDSTE